MGKHHDPNCKCCAEKAKAYEEEHEHVENTFAAGTEATSSLHSDRERKEKQAKDNALGGF